MRVCLIAAIAALLSVPTPSVAAPTSMMQTLPPAQVAPTHDGGRRMGWLTKWFQKGQPAATVPSATPPIAVYQAPPATATEQQATQVALAPEAAVQPTPSLPPASSAEDCKQLRKQGHSHDRAGDLAAAEALYRRAIGSDPTSAAALNDLGLCLARQGKLAASADVLRQAIAMRPNKALYRNNIATVLVELGQSQEALANLQSVYSSGPAHYNLGQLLSRAGKSGEAVQQLQAAVRLEPTFAPARDALAAMQTGSLASAEVIDVPPPPVSPAPTFAESPVERVAAAVPAVEIVPQGVAIETPPDFDEPAGVPSFPRLLPPVLDR